MATTLATAPVVKQGVGQSAGIPQAATRNIAVDAYRGFVMFLMMAEVLRLAKVAANYPGNWFWSTLAFHQTHSEWIGCSLHDLIQPSFSFLVGVALPYSIASRIAKGGTFGKMFLHALWRALLLASLGVFLRSLGHQMTNFTFEDTLSQIGFGYPILFLLGFRSPRWQWSALGVILVGYWLAWAVYPAPGPGFDWQAVGVPADWPNHLSGFAAHWDKNSNLGQAFDVWFLNLFPRPQHFDFNSGGYLTLSFIPTLGTMILGLIAGRWLKSSAPKIPMKQFVVAGVVGVAASLLIHVLGICPIVKRIWTPSWVLFSGGICFLFLAAFCWLIETKGWKKWSFPLVVIGTNSIAAYCMAHLFERFFTDSLRITLGPHAFEIFGTGLQPFVQGWAILACLWAILYWMYRRKVFLRI
jgi:heparan-alpha-glucosaminide N-acetyltransferase